MKLTLSIYYSILFGHLRPWIDENNSEDKFRHLLSSQLRNNKDNPNKYFKSLIEASLNKKISLESEVIDELRNFESISIIPELLESIDLVELPNFHDKPTEFYFYTINNLIVSAVNALYHNVKECNDEDIAKYNVSGIHKAIESFLKKAAEINKTEPLSVYVLNDVKLSLFNLYTVVSKLFPAYGGSEVLTENEIIHLIAPDYENSINVEFSNSFNINNFIKKRDKANQLVSSSLRIKEAKEPSQDSKPTLNVKRTESHLGYKGKLSYDDILKKDQFARLEEQLYEYEFIDADYNFTKKHDKKVELAAIFKLLIQKGYFRKSNRSHTRGFEDAHYRQYLDHRYNVNTSQQFSRLTAENISKVASKYYWLNTL